MKKGILPKNKQGRIPHKRTEYNGRIYDSLSEAGYAHHLEGLKHAHNLEDRVVRVENQVAYPIYVKKKHVFDYFADFRVTYGDKRQEVIDVKSPITAKDPVFRIKKKCVEAYYGIEVKEIIVKSTKKLL